MRVKESVRGGFALLEVLIGLAILAIAGAAVLLNAQDALHTLDRVLRDDRESREASAFLDAVDLWNRHELDARLGTRRQGGWWLRIQRPAPTLYSLALINAGGDIIMQTALYRPVSER